MRRWLLALAIAISFAAPAFAQPSADLAPADRYFGRLKMSILGVRNSIRDLTARAEANPADAEHIFDKAVLVEDALRDWHAHFPRDPWIPQYGYGLAHLYAQLDYEGARIRQSEMVSWLISTFPRSTYAQLPRI